MSDLRARCLTAMVDAMVDEAPVMFDDYAAAGLDALLAAIIETFPRIEEVNGLVQALKDDRTREGDNDETS